MKRYAKWLRCHFWVCDMGGSSLLVKKDIPPRYNLIIGRKYFCYRHGTHYTKKFPHPLTREEYDAERRNLRLW